MREPDYPQNRAEKGKQGRIGADNGCPRTARDPTRRIRLPPCRQQSQKREYWHRQEHDHVGEELFGQTYVINLSTICNHFSIVNQKYFNLSQ